MEECTEELRIFSTSTVSDIPIKLSSPSNPLGRVGVGLKPTFLDVCPENDDPQNLPVHALTWFGCETASPRRRLV
jgi:hypothetical protein